MVAELSANYCKSWVICSNIWAPFLGCYSILKGLACKALVLAIFRNFHIKTFLNLYCKQKMKRYWDP